MRDFCVVDVRQKDEPPARDYLAFLLNCPKLRFYENQKCVSPVSSLATCKSPYLLIDLRSEYPRVIPNPEDSFGCGFQTEAEAVQAFEKLKDDNRPIMLQFTSRGLDPENYWIFKNGDDLSNYLVSVQLPLHERRAHVVIGLTGKVRFGETVGNNLGIFPMRFLDKPTEKEYHIINLAGNDLKERLLQFFPEYEIELQELLPREIRSVPYFNKTAEDQYLVVQKDVGSEFAFPVLTSKYSYCANSFDEAQKIIDNYRARNVLYIPVCVENSNTMANVVSNSSEELVRHLLKNFSCINVDKRLTISCFSGAYYATVSEILNCDVERISIRLINEWKAN